MKPAANWFRSMAGTVWHYTRLTVVTVAYALAGEKS